MALSRDELDRFNLGRLQELIERMIKERRGYRKRFISFIDFNHEFRKEFDSINNPTELIKDLSHMAEDDYVPDEEFILKIIKKICEFKLIDYVFGFYQIALIHHRPLSIAIVNEVLYQISLRSPIDISLGLRIFDEAVSIEKVDSYSFRKIIYMLDESKSNDFRLIHSIYLQGKERGYDIYRDFVNDVLKVMSKCSRPDPDSVIDILNDAKRRCIADVHTVNSTLSCLAKACAVDKAIVIFNQMGAQANSNTYTAILNVLAKGPRPNLDEAHRIYLQAVSRGCVQPFTFVTMLNLISKTERPDVPRALEIFEDAKRTFPRVLPNEFLYSSILHVIFKSERPDVGIAQPIFDEGKHDKKIDKIAFFNFIDILAKAGSGDEHIKAYTLIAEAEKDGVIQSCLDKTGPTIDLHDTSYGLAYYIVRQRIMSEYLTSSEGVKLEVITGKGIHSSSSGGIPPVKEAMQQLMRDMGAIGIREDKPRGARVNTGRMTIIIPPKRLTSMFVHSGREHYFEPSVRRWNRK